MTARTMLVATLASILAFANVALASTINTMTATDGTPIIVVVGDFVAGDEKTFNNVAIGFDRAIVVLASNGGKAFVGMEIGRTINIKSFGTIVLPNTACLSSCALSWIAGKPRFMYPTSTIGFHAIYTIGVDSVDVSSAGNALVGQYLQQLGLNTNTIIFATSAPPTSMAYLTPQLAKTIGLDVGLIDDTKAADPTNNDQVSVPSAAVESQATKNSTDTTAISDPPDTTPLIDNRPWTILQYTDLPGQDLPGMPVSAASPEECRRLCFKRGQCSAFTFNTEKQVCFLKIGAGEALQFTGAVSGYVTSQNFVTRMGKDYGSSVLFRTNHGTEVLQPPYKAYRNANLGWCQDKCVSGKACKAFNFYPDGECRLLRKRVPTRANTRAISGTKLD